MAEPRGKRVLAWVQRVLPWASLAVGIVGALMMDRGPARGAIVAGVALASWFVLMLVMWLERIHEARPGEAALNGDGAVAMRLDQPLEQPVAQAHDVLAAMQRFAKAEQSHGVTQRGDHAIDGGMEFSG